ncbi:unnamed protein product [Zymoseptoria tritici ST99CH_3D7]|uniref:Uncharacterized protein n=1 Tax=Zymoseptoria tritici (strain ST99CH_3D7) TaxID=1276538 RepID=A0A1X7S9P4_ZYMT9|nr:unnamed protein product [Zymoseptoria tritici ST99CH_3D7]
MQSLSIVQSVVQTFCLAHMPEPPVCPRPTPPPPSTRHGVLALSATLTVIALITMVIGMTDPVIRHGIDPDFPLHFLRHQLTLAASLMRLCIILKSIQITFERIGACSKHGLTRVATTSTHLFNSVIRLAISLPSTAKSVCKAAMLRIHGSLSSTSTHFINCVVRITAPAIALTSAGYNACKAAMLQANKSVASTSLRLVNFVVRIAASAIASTRTGYNACKAAIIRTYVVTTLIHFITYTMTLIAGAVQPTFKAPHPADSTRISTSPNRGMHEKDGDMHRHGEEDTCTGGDGEVAGSWVLLKDVKACS